MSVDCRWVELHKKISDYIWDHFKDDHLGLAAVLNQLEIDDGGKPLPITTSSEELKFDDIDPFTFMGFFYKFERPDKLNGFFKKLFALWGLEISFPLDFSSLARRSSPHFVYPRNQKKEVPLLWKLFEEIRNKNVTQNTFESVAKINGMASGSVSLCLYYFDSDNYLVINGRTKHLLGLDSLVEANFTWDVYQSFLKTACNKYPGMSFPEIMHQALEKDLSYWIFQGNPDTYDLASSLKDGALKTWGVNAHKKEIKSGDKVILWLTGQNTGCYALATVSSEIISRKDDERELKYYKKKTSNEPVDKVEIGIDYNFSSGPVLKKSLESLASFQDFKGGGQGTNFVATQKQYDDILRIGVGYKFMPPKSDPINTIFYGPPGTGKTYEVQKKWIPKYTDEQTVQTKEEFCLELVQNLSWWETITVVMLDMRQGKVQQIYEHPLLQAKNSLSQAKTPKNTIWSSLQTHTKNECEFVKFSKRDEPLLFSKAEDGIWSVDSELAQSETPELLKVLEKFRNYTPTVKVNKRYTFVTFHQAFGYEEFVEGIRPVIDNGDSGEIQYRVEPGVFLEICSRAAKDPDNQYAIFIDEINRGNIAKILGELITLIEPDKRLGMPNALTVKLPYSKTEFGVPANLDIVGTMNTADRSIAPIDSALRRRFTFVEKMPKPDLIKGSDGQGNIEADGIVINLQELLRKINLRIEFLLNRDQTIGHSYFYDVKTLPQLRDAFKRKIIPLLQEYFYEDWHRIQLVFKDVVSSDGKAHEHQIICHKSFNEVDVIGFDHDDYEDDCRYWVNETLTPEAIRKIYE